MQLPLDESLFDVDSQIIWYCRSLTRGVPRHFKQAYLLQRWQQAQAEGNTFEVAVVFSLLSALEKVDPSIKAPFNFNALSNDVCVARFRFSKDELVTLVALMGLDDVVTRERTKATAMEALCIMLYKLAVPMRWVDLSDVFERSPSGLSNIFLHLLDLVDSRFKGLLKFSGDLLCSRLDTYADAIFSAGAPYTNIWCFIDGTVRGICRPQPRKACGKRKYLTQQSMYNGHKRKHSLKFQSVVTPDGMISHLFGPFPGRNHDIKMYQASKLAERVRSDDRFREYRIFGDCAYGRDDVMLSPFEGAIGNMTSAQLHVNGKMSKMRVSVE